MDSPTYDVTQVQAVSSTPSASSSSSPTKTNESDQSFADVLSSVSSEAGTVNTRETTAEDNEDEALWAELAAILGQSTAAAGEAHTLPVDAGKVEATGTETQRAAGTPTSVEQTASQASAVPDKVQAAKNAPAEPTVQEENATLPQTHEENRTLQTTGKDTPQAPAQALAQAPAQVPPSEPGGDRRDEALIRPFQKVAGDMFKQWARDGRISVSDERVKLPEQTVDMTMSGQMIAMKLQTGTDAPSTNGSMAFVGREATDGPDFSARGSAFRISPTAKQEAKLFLMQSAATADSAAVTMTLNTTSGGGASTDSGNTNDKAKGEASPSVDLSTGSGAIDTGAFAATLHSQGPIHASSAKPAEAIYDRPVLADRIVNQIVRDVKVHIKNDNTQITMRLDPPELGSLKVEIVSQGGVITANLQSGNDTVRSLLETHLPVLKESLSQAGIKVDSFNVSTGADMGQFTQHRNGNWQQSKQQHFHGQQVDNGQLGAFMPAASAAATSGGAAGFNWLA